LSTNLKKFVGVQSVEDKKDERVQLLSGLDHCRQIRPIHLSLSTFTNAGFRQESGNSNLEGMAG